MRKFDNYQHFTFEDFIEDESFRNWVLDVSPEQDELWQAFKSAYPAKTEELERARTFLLGTRDYFEKAGIKEEKIEFRLTQLLKQSSLVDQSEPKLRSIQNLTRRWLAAASIALAIGLLGWFWVNQSSPALEMIATNYGEWRSIELPDGSKVKLNANSKIKFFKHWESGIDRSVWLNGEAFFEVTKDSKGAKFTVHTDDLAVEVLGTSFNVHSRSEQTEVFLEEGKVRLDMGTEKRTMESGDFISYSSKQKKITAFTQTSTELHASWKDGSLILNDKSLAEIMKKMEEIFGYKIVLQNEELLKERRTVAIPMEAIEVAIPILESTFGLEMKLEDNQLIVQ